MGNACAEIFDRLNESLSRLQNFDCHATHYETTRERGENDAAMRLLPKTKKEEEKKNKVCLTQVKQSWRAPTFLQTWVDSPDENEMRLAGLAAREQQQSRPGFPGSPEGIFY